MTTTTIEYWVIVLDGGQHADSPGLTVYAELGGQQYDVITRDIDSRSGYELAQILAYHGWQAAGDWTSIGPEGRTCRVTPTSADALVAGVIEARRVLQEAQEALAEAVIDAELRRKAAGKAGHQGKPSQLAIATAAGLGSRETVSAWLRAARVAATSTTREA